MSVEFGKSLIIVGVVIAALGVVIVFKPHLPWLGHLPGDIFIEKENVEIYFPLVTCLLVSAVLSLVMYLFRK